MPENGVSSDPMPQLSTLTEMVETLNIGGVCGQDNGFLEWDRAATD
jgi:hypothetical protein